MTKSKTGLYIALVAFVALFGVTIATGTIAGMERDSNIYGGPAEMIFPVAGIATLVAAAIVVVLAVKNRSSQR